MIEINFQYHTLDSTTPWYDWICYCEIHYQLEIQGKPSLQRFMAYHRYLKQIGVK